MLWITASAASKVGHEDRLCLSFALPENCVALFVVVLHRGTGPALSDVMLEIAIVIHKLSNPNSALIVHFNVVLLALAAWQQICDGSSAALARNSHPSAIMVYDGPVEEYTTTQGTMALQLTVVHGQS